MRAVLCALTSSRQRQCGASNGTRVVPEGSGHDAQSAVDHWGSATLEGSLNVREKQFPSLSDTASNHYNIRVQDPHDVGESCTKLVADACP